MHNQTTLIRSADENEIIFVLRDEVARTNGGELRRHLLDNVRRTRRLIVDCGGADARDTSILACLVEALHLARCLGVEFQLSRVSGEIQRIFDLFRLRPLFPVVDQAA